MGEYIRFDNRHVGNVIDRQKRATIRKGEPFVDRGDVVDLKTGHGNVFAQAEITNVLLKKAYEIPRIDFEYHRDYHSYPDFVSSMSDYYDEVEHDTEFTIMWFDIQ